jgi:HEAT repeat protein
LQVLAKIGGPEAVQTLLDAALSGDAVSQQAGELLKTISSDDADQAILTRLRNAEPKQQAVLIPLVGARRITAATAAVKNLLDDPQEPVRLAAITALGQLVSLNELDLLTRRALQGSSPAESQAAQAALKAAAMRMTDREACSAKLAALVPEASAEQQVYLLELLTQLSGPKALATVAELAQANDPMLKDTATRLLGEWPDATAAPALLAIAKSEKDTKYQVRAMRGYLRIARQLQMPDDERIAMFRTALDVASRKEEKQLAFDILTRIPSAATLDLATSYVRDPALRNAAAGAAIKIAPKVLNADPKGVAAAMQKVLDAGVGGNLAPRAKQLLGQARGAGA